MPPPSPRIFNKTTAASRAPRVVSVLASLLERAAERGDAEASVAAAAHTASAAFRGKAVPGIPVRRYVERICRYAGCSPACFVVAYVYLDRLARGNGVGGGGGEDEADGDEGEGGEEETAAVAVVGIDSYNVHRLLITSVLVAAKFMDDRYPRLATPPSSSRPTPEIPTRLLFAAISNPPLLLLLPQPSSASPLRPPARRSPFPRWRIGDPRSVRDADRLIPAGRSSHAA